jgi:hypothetical protein
MLCIGARHEEERHGWTTLRTGFCHTTLKLGQRKQHRDAGDLKPMRILDLSSAKATREFFAAHAEELSRLSIEQAKAFFPCHRLDRIVGWDGLARSSWNSQR